VNGVLKRLILNLREIEDLRKPYSEGYLKRAYRRSGLEDLAGEEEIPLSLTN
jgi:hypothetical protein